MQLQRRTVRQWAAQQLTSGPAPLSTAPVPWKPHAYQEWALEFILKQRAAGLLLDPGLGKTSVTLAGIKVLLQEKLIKRALIIAPLRPCYLVWPEQIEHWQDFTSLRYNILHGGPRKMEQALEQDVDINIINPDGLPWLMQANRLRKLRPELLVIDECFAGDTLVSTVDGVVKISMLKVGILVHTSSGPQVVRRIMCRQPSGAIVTVRANNGQEITCTEDHIFFTEVGWLPAKYLKGRRLLCVAEVSNMRQQVLRAPENVYLPRQSADLLTVLRYEAEMAAAQSSPVAQEGNSYNEAQSQDVESVEHRYSMEPRSTNQDSSYPQAQEFITVEWPTWREWQDINCRGAGAASAASNFYSQLRDRVGWQAARLSLVLQSGLWQSYNEGSFGNRWWLPQQPTTTSTGQEERNKTQGTWVESVTYNQPGSIPLVWNLEVENCPHFEIAGCALVHNSSKFKHTRTRRFKLLRPALPLFDWRWILTGTPNPNGYLDLFGQMQILDLGRALGRYITHYRTQYFYPTGFGGYTWKLQEGAEERIHAAIKPLVLRLDAEDYIKMPTPKPNIIRVDLPAAARKVYEELEEDMITELDSGEVVTAINSGSALNKCCQVASGALYYMADPTVARTARRHYEVLHAAKLEALQDLIDELQGSPLLLAYEYQHDLDRILQMLQGKSKQQVPFLGSGVSMADSLLIEKAWNADRIPVLPGHPASMGHGLNLQRGSCHHVCFFTATWDFEMYDQFIRRVRRQGNRFSKVYVHHLIARNTVDEAKLAKLHRKAKTQQGLLDALRTYVKGRAKR